MIRLDVWITLPNGELLKAGELVVDDPDERGALTGRFRYIPEYLKHPKSFPLDPLHLPLTTDLFDAARLRAGVHGVFEDSLPDNWGRMLMARRYRLGRTEQRVPNLLRLLGGQGMGALSYAEKGSPSPSSAVISSHHLQTLARLVEKFEQTGAVDDDEFSLLFEAGSSPGGARPKVLVENKSGAYLAKFASINDRLDVVSLEAASMDLARRAGVETAETGLVALGSRNCLLVKRFDINPAGGRNHLISMQTLLAADYWYNAGYVDLAEIIRKVSVRPGKDLLQLYRQMVYNVMIGNTDDHLKNFCMLHDQDGFRLSPAFDLTPNINFNLEHVLRIGLDNRPPSLETILSEAKHFGIKRRRIALEIVAEVQSAVADWSTIFSTNQVPSRDIEIIGKEIQSGPLFRAQNL